MSLISEIVKSNLRVENDPSGYSPRSRILPSNRKSVIFSPASDVVDYDRVFELRDIIHCHRKVSRGKYLDPLLDSIKRIVLIYRYWTELRVPEIFNKASEDYKLDTEEVKSGKWDIFIRISQGPLNHMNLNYFGQQAHVQIMLRQLFGFGILERTTEYEMDRFGYNPRDLKKSYPKGYKLNLKGLFKYLKVIRESIIDPINERFGVDVLKLVKGENDVSLYTSKELAEKLREIYTLFEKVFGGNFIEGSLANPGRNTVAITSELLKKEVGLTFLQANLVESRFYSEAKESLEAIKKNKMKFPKQVIDFLEMCAKVQENSQKFNYDKSLESGEISPHKFKVTRKFRGNPNKPMLGNLTCRVSNDLCSVTKVDPVYKGKQHPTRKSIFKEIWGTNRIYEYDTKNSIHADNYGVLKRKLLEADLYSEILPPLLKASLEKDQKWMEILKDKVLSESGETFDEFFEAITNRNTIKKLSNATYALSEVGGKLYTFILNRFKKGSENF